jgi:hypothetical protein
MKPDAPLRRTVDTPVISPVAGLGLEAPAFDQGPGEPVDDLGLLVIPRGDSISQQGNEIFLHWRLTRPHALGIGLRIVHCPASDPESEYRPVVGRL